MVNLKEEILKRVDADIFYSAVEKSVKSKIFPVPTDVPKNRYGEFRMGTDETI